MRKPEPDCGGGGKMFVLRQKMRGESVVIKAIKRQHRPKLAPLSLFVINQVLYDFPSVAFTPFTQDTACRLKLYHD